MASKRAATFPSVPPSPHAKHGARKSPPSLNKLLTPLCLLLLLLLTTTVHGEPLAREILAEINLARTAPKTYASFLREFRQQFRGKDYRLRDSDIIVRTEEGVRAVDEAIRVLSRQQPLTPLAWSNGLAAAATELAAEQRKSGAIGHGGTLHRGMRARIESHGTWEGEIGENIGYGPDEAVARDMVMQLIINDGVPDRGHRKNIYRRAFGVAGVACGPHPRYGQMCVIDFAAGFTE